MKFMSEAWMKVHFLWRSLQYLTAKETAQYILTFFIFYFYRLPIDCVEGSSSTPSGFAIGLNECHPECWPVFQLFWRSTNISHSRKLNFEFIHSVYWFVVYRFSQSAASCTYQPIWIFSLQFTFCIINCEFKWLYYLFVLGLTEGVLSSDSKSLGQMFVCDKLHLRKLNSKSEHQKAWFCNTPNLYWEIMNSPHRVGGL